MAVANLSRVANPKSTVQVSAAPSARPVQDEWGIYDPEQAGFEAVLRRLPAGDDDADAAPGAPAGSR
jgi:hypothetical protein